MGQPADPLRYGIMILNGSGVTVDHCSIQYCSIGIYVAGGTGHKISHNTIRWNSCLNIVGGMEGTGIYLYSATSYILTSTTVNANYLYDNDGVGVAVYGDKVWSASVNGIKILSNYFSNNSAFNACSSGGINYNLESINLFYNNGTVTVNYNKFLYPIEDGPGSVLGDWHSAPGVLSKTGNNVYYGQKISFSGTPVPLP